MTSLAAQQRVFNRLNAPIRTRDDLLRLFVNDLGFEHIEQPIPLREDTFGRGQALDLAQRCRPMRLAGHGEFQIFYAELDGDRLDYTRQRILATKLLETWPDALFVFARANTLGNPAGAEIHIVNVKGDTTASRRVFRRFRLGPGEQYRTAAEQFARLDLTDRPTISLLGLRERLDPACGSGAFPMGLLHKLVFILGKLDPHNEQWKQKQIAKASEIPDATVREKTLADIEQAFAANELDYGRKLYLIENCIYGVDIQPIAVQIAKMRFFISLTVDQKADPNEPNLGIRPLPNLETKFVAANTLIGIERPAQQMLRNPQIDAKEAELRQVRERHFTARTPATKAKCRELDAKLRAEISALLRADGFPRETTEQLANWNPYDQNASADFFDPEWMFGIREGFDIVIGNPPYVRIQTLTQTDAKQAGWLKEHYVSAGKGNYDLYVVFVERGLQLLQPTGQLAYILPHKFFNAQYGEPLRKLLADGKHLRHVVHFGDQKVFTAAINCVCLLFLAKAGSDTCRWARADDLRAWLATQRAPETDLPAARITTAEWNFAVGKAAGLFEKLQRMPVKLGDVAEIFVGLQTSADDVFIMNFVSETAQTITLHSKALQCDWTFEKELLHPLVSGTDVLPFSTLPNRQFILFPYRIANEQAALIPLKEIVDSWPRTGEYLKENKRRLEGRERGAFSGNGWHRFGRNQNLGIQERKKLCVPRLAEYLHAALDSFGTHFLDNVDVCGVTLRNSAADYSLAYLLALLNSSALRWYFPQVAAPLRIGAWSANRQYLSLLPIPVIDFSSAAERAEHDAVVKLVDKILAAKRADAAADTSAWEREIDQLVYRLYGLTPEEIKIVEEGLK